MVRSLLALIPAITKLVAALYSDPRVPAQAKISLGAILAYLVSPVDLIPDFIPILGQMDDLLLAAIALDGILNQIDRALVLQHWTASEEALETASRVAQRLSAIVPMRIKRRIFAKTMPKGEG